MVTVLGVIMDKNEIAQVLKATDGSVRKTAKTLGLDFEELKTFVQTEPDLAEVLEFAQTRAAILAEDGRMERAAHRLHMTRQGLYHRIAQSSALQEVVRDLKKAQKARLGNISEALDTIQMDEDEIALLALERDLSPRIASRQWLIAKIQEVTHRSERDVIAQIKKEPLRTKFEGKLPPSNTKKFEASHVIFPVSLTFEQWEWMRAQKRGTAANLIRKSKPITGPLPPEPALPYQTSYSISQELLFKLNKAAEELGTSAGVVFRHIINLAMKADRQPRHQHAA